MESTAPMREGQTLADPRRCPNRIPKFYLGKITNKVKIIDILAFAEYYQDSSERLFYSCFMFRELLTENILQVKYIMTPRDPIKVRIYDGDIYPGDHLSLFLSPQVIRKTQLRITIVDCKRSFELLVNFYASERLLRIQSLRIEGYCNSNL